MSEQETSSKPMQGVASEESERKRRRRSNLLSARQEKLYDSFLYLEVFASETMNIVMASTTIGVGKFLIYVALPLVTVEINGATR